MHYENLVDQNSWGKGESALKNKPLKPRECDFVVCPASGHLLVLPSLLSVTLVPTATPLLPMLRTVAPLHSLIHRCLYRRR